MRLLELSVARLEEVKPYVDTLLLPVGAMGGQPADREFAADLLWVRQVAMEVEQRITGRVWLLPETVHTLGHAGGTEMPEDVLAGYLYYSLLPYRELGVTKAVLLYSAATPGYAIETARKLLEQQGYQVLPLFVEPMGTPETAAEAAVQQIIPLWNREM